MVGAKNTKRKVDCPEVLVDIARSKFEKAVVKEFIFLEEEVKELKNHMEWIKKLLFTVLLTIIVNIIIKLL